MNIANLVQQKIISDSPAELLLGSPVPSFVTVSNAFQNGDKVFYSLRSGNNRETGYGTYVSSTNSISRDFLFEQLVSNIYDTSPVTPLTALAGDTVSCSPTVQGLTTHYPVYKREQFNLDTPNGAYGNAAPSISSAIGTVEAFHFSPTTTQSLGVSLSIPHTIEQNTELSVDVHWFPKSGNAGNVIWALEYFIVDYNGVVASTSTVSATENTQGITNQHLISSLSPINMSGPVSQLKGRLYRVGGSDTFPDEVVLLNVTGAYKATRVGTPKSKTNNYSWS